MELFKTVYQYHFQIAHFLYVCYNFRCRHLFLDEYLKHLVYLKCMLKLYKYLAMSQVSYNNNIVIEYIIAVKIFLSHISIKISKKNVDGT